MLKCAGCLRVLVNKRNILWLRSSLTGAVPLCGPTCSDRLFGECTELPAYFKRVKAEIKERELNLKEVIKYGIRREEQRD